MGRVQTVSANGLTWPASQFLPTFATPAPFIDCIDVDSLPSAQQALFVSLEGIVNRTQPELTSQAAEALHRCDPPVREMHSSNNPVCGYYLQQS